MWNFEAVFLKTSSGQLLPRNFGSYWNAPFEQVEEAARMGLNAKAGTQKSAQKLSSLDSKKEAAQTKVLRSSSKDLFQKYARQKVQQDWLHIYSPAELCGSGLCRAKHMKQEAMESFAFPYKMKLHLKFFKRNRENIYLKVAHYFAK